MPTFIPVEVPAALRNCPELPKVPNQSATQAGVADYVVQLHSTAMTCRVHLIAVDEILTKVEASAANPG